MLGLQPLNYKRLPTRLFRAVTKRATKDAYVINGGVSIFLVVSANFVAFVFIFPGLHGHLDISGPYATYRHAL